MVERKRIHRTSRVPEGFLYHQNFISEEEENELLFHIRQLPFEGMKYRQYVAKRRTVTFGVNYSFDSRQVSPGAPMPQFLYPLREKIAGLASQARPEEFVEALVTEYEPGAAIGWHRDAPQFGTVCGVSLAGGCRMRLRLATKEENEITSIELEPRSAYVFQNEARWRWQHSIPAVKQLRYSITFRTLREKK